MRQSELTPKADKNRATVDFFKNRNMLVEELQFRLINAAYSRLIVYTHIEKDRIMRISQLLKQLEGVRQ